VEKILLNSETNLDKMMFEDTMFRINNDYIEIIIRKVLRRK